MSFKSILLIELGPLFPTQGLPESRAGDCEHGWILRGRANGAAVYQSVRSLTLQQKCPLTRPAWMLTFAL